MGAYFRTYKKGKTFRKTLIRKNNGSLYPSVVYFNKKILLIKKYLGDFVVDTKINYDGQRIRLEQPFIKGEDLFVFLDKEKPKRFAEFIKRLNNLYLKSGIMLDLLNKENILVTKSKEIRVVDVWPLFFKERIISGDINKESYEENVQKFKQLKRSLLIK